MDQEEKKKGGGGGGGNQQNKDVKYLTDFERAFKGCDLTLTLRQIHTPAILTHSNYAVTLFSCYNYLTAFMLDGS